MNDVIRHKIKHNAHRALVSLKWIIFAIIVGSKSAVLVTGYSQTNIYYYDPADGSTKSMSLDAADKLFTKAGNLFFTYLNR